MQDIDNTRSDEMRRRMVLLHENGTCLFCDEGFTLMEKTKIFEGSLWYITINDNPYSGALNHVMVVPNRHIIQPEDLTGEELLELTQVMIPWLRNKLGMEGLSGLFRFGNTKRTGATIHHLHFHFIEGADRISNESEPIFAVVGFKPSVANQSTT